MELEIRKQIAVLRSLYTDNRGSKNMSPIENKGVVLLKLRAQF